MDIVDFDSRNTSAEGIEWTLKDLHGDEVLGTDNEPIKFRTRGLDSARERGRLAKSKQVHEKDDPEAYGKELMAADAKYLADFLVGWSENFTYKGEPMPFNRANAIAVMSIPFIAQQQQEVLKERGNFMVKASA